MADLQQNALRDALRRHGSDIEQLRRRTSSGTFVSYEGILTASVSNPLSAFLAEFPASGTYSRNGDIVIVQTVAVAMPTFNTAGSGPYRVPLPFPCAGLNNIIGRGFIVDFSSGSARTPVDVVGAGGPSYALLTTSAGAYVTGASPLAWAVNDSILIGTLTYRTYG